jgi:hypothetical protein
VASRAEQLASLLKAASKGEGMEADTFYRKLESLLGGKAAKKAWKVLREGGLVIGQPEIGQTKGPPHLTSIPVSAVRPASSSTKMR